MLMTMSIKKSLMAMDSIDNSIMAGKQSMDTQKYWKSIFGIDIFKIEWYFKYFLYKTLGLKLPKLKEQRGYWTRRGEAFMQEILSSGYLEREMYFQNILIHELSAITFESCFEAGCGFGWNIRRVKEDFPDKKVAGLDFSVTQLNNSKSYLFNQDCPVGNGDICHMPFQDNAFDVGFSMGVCMNIHQDKIKGALQEMIRVCGKTIIHIEWDENHTTRKLREKRAFKTNIISHNYQALYESLGKKVGKLLTYRDFAKAYREHQISISKSLHRWEGFEGPEKYIFIVIEL